MEHRLGIEQIRGWLPHRQPFLMVDRILEIHPVGDLKDLTWNSAKVGIKVVGLKNVSYNEPVFAGHFPSFSIFPGVMIIESMAQVASFSIYPYIEHDLERVAKAFQCILLGVDNVRFRRPVVPGDTLRITTEVTRCRGKIWAFKAQAHVGDQLAAEAEVMANLTLNTGDS